MARTSCQVKCDWVAFFASSSPCRVGHGASGAALAVSNFGVLPTHVCAWFCPPFRCLLISWLKAIQKSINQPCVFECPLKSPPQLVELRWRLGPCRVPRYLAGDSRGRWSDPRHRNARRDFRVPPALAFRSLLVSKYASCYRAATEADAKSVAPASSPVRTNVHVARGLIHPPFPAITALGVP